MSKKVASIKIKIKKKTVVNNKKGKIFIYKKVKNRENVLPFLTRKNDVLYLK